MNWKRAAFLAVRILGLTIMMFICIAMASGITGLGSSAEARQEAGQAVLAVLGMCLVNCAVLAYPILRSRWHGLKLIETVFLLFFGIQTFMGQIETLLFADALDIGVARVRSIVLSGALTALLFAPLAVLILGKMRRPETAERPARAPRPRRAAAWRVVLLPVIYVCLYFLFGYFIAWQSAEVRELYSGSTELRPFFAHLWGLLQSNPWIFLLQLARGLLWVGLALPMVFMMKGERWETSLALGLLFGLLLTTPLLLPNPYLSTSVRLVHFIETATSTFVYGCLIGWWLRPLLVPRSEPLTAATPA
jgi:hypothetical protein